MLIQGKKNEISLNERIGNSAGKMNANNYEIATGDESKFREMQKDKEEKEQFADGFGP